MKKLFLVSIIIFFALIFDIGNPDAIRQGTEGFYLQVAKEMFEMKALLTPYYLGEPHWSKPPFLFLMPQPFYYLSGASSLFFSRVSMLIISIFLSIIASKKIENISGIKASNYLIFLFSTVAFFKYSRIFMMEMPLALLGFLSAIYFYSYLESKKSNELYSSVLFGTLCCLVKGPVSFVMLIPSFSLYYLYNYIVYKKHHLKEILSWTLLTVFLSSLWFIYQFVIFGDDFFNYFFLRENLGKFSSKSYPMRHVFQGLFLYSLPWSLLIPPLIWRFYKTGVAKLSDKRSGLTIFLSICFMCFFLVWLIPSQRSHHYALPAIPFLLSIIYLEYFLKSTMPIWMSRVYKGYLSLLSTIGVFVIILTLILIEHFPETNYLSLFLSLALLIISIVLVVWKRAPKYYFTSSIIIISVFWSLLIPNYILPLIPHQIQKSTREIQLIGAVHRKPYFISQSLGRDIKILSLTQVESFLSQDGSVLIIHDNFYKSLSTNTKYTILKEWDVWKRGIKPKEIFQSLKNRSIHRLRSKMFLIASKPL